MSNKAKIREAAMSLNPIDDALFMKMAESRLFCEEILQVFLGDSNLSVLENYPQHTVKNLQGRSCILDLKCRLGTGKIVHVEIQKSDDDDHQRRVRYNASLLTANTANPGDKFRDIPDIISVFISRFDVFKLGKVVYHVERFIRETGDVVFNGSQEIYINAEVNDESDIANLMKVFVVDSWYDDARFPVTSERKRTFKSSEQGVNEMCEIIERQRAEAFAEGEAIGEARGKAIGEAHGKAIGESIGEARGKAIGERKAIIQLVKKNLLSIEDAIRETGMTEAAFRQELAML